MSGNRFHELGDCVSWRALRCDYKRLFDGFFLHWVTACHNAQVRLWDGFFLRYADLPSLSPQPVKLTGGWPATARLTHELMRLDVF
jgi:hypothetical protein